MDDCQDLPRLASGLAAGELSADEHERLAAHLAQCPQCRAQLLADDPLLATLLAAPLPPQAIDLSARLVAAAAPELAQRRRAGSGQRWWASLSPGLRLATAALWMLGLGVGWWLSTEALEAQAAAAQSQEPTATVSLLAGKTPGSLVASYDTLLAAEGP